MIDVTPDTALTESLLQRISGGERPALDQLLARYRPRLLAFVEARLEPGLRARLDPSDVVQEAQLEVVQRMDDFLKRRPMPFHLWVRKTAYERLLKLRRRHRHQQQRTLEREVPWPERSSLLAAGSLLAGGGSPSERLQAQELAQRIGAAVATLAERDREILLMRQVERLPYEEIACLLEIEATAARKRYGRALLRLRQVLVEAGLLEEQ
jgi:RNA polymerase sigma-70 factor (ECF subfamily)